MGIFSDLAINNENTGHQILTIDGLAIQLAAVRILPRGRQNLAKFLWPRGKVALGSHHALLFIIVEDGFFDIHFSYLVPTFGVEILTIDG
jgi:hypothetical protein